MLKKIDCKYCLISRYLIVFGLQNVSEFFNDLKMYISILENFLIVMVLELFVVNESVMENVIKYVVNFIVEVK